MFRYSALFELEEISRHWGLFLMLGVSLMVLGALALGSTWITTLASVTVLGILLITAGILETLVAFGVRYPKGLLVRVLTGVLSIAIGTVLVRYPLASVAGLTIVLAWLFLTTGLLRTITAVALRFPAWEWTILESVGSVILSLVIWLSWPVSAFWVIGALVGTCMMFRGLGWLMFSLSARHVRKVAFA